LDGSILDIPVPKMLKYISTGLKNKIYTPFLKLEYIIIDVCIHQLACPYPLRSIRIPHPIAVRLVIAMIVVSMWDADIIRWGPVGGACSNCCH